jgi:cbb3-type cytochrome oxidase subunit 3
MIELLQTLAIVAMLTVPYLAAWWLFRRAEREEQDEHARERFL